MAELTLTVKVQLVISENDKAAVNRTLEAYREGCNYVSEYIYKAHDLSQSSLNKELYYVLRERFSLKAQMSQSVLKTVIAQYKMILKNQNGKWIKALFKKPQADLVRGRDYALLKDGRFSIGSIDGRLKIPYIGKGFEKYFDASVYTFGTAKIVLKHGKYYLYIPVTFNIPDSAYSDIVNVVGVDRGINFIAVTYSSSHKSFFLSGKQIKRIRYKYIRVRQLLKLRHTPSSRQRLKAIGRRENRWIRDLNHCVSKTLVKNNPKHTLFVLENFTDHNGVVPWSFYDLEYKLIYKALCSQSSVIKVDPAYTSQTCPICGHTEIANRNRKIHLFCCKNCCYKSNDDRISAMNLYRMGINFLSRERVPGTVAVQHV